MGKITDAPYSNDNLCTVTNKQESYIIRLRLRLRLRQLKDRPHAGARYACK